LILTPSEYNSTEFSKKQANVAVYDDNNIIAKKLSDTIYPHSPKLSAVC